MIITGIADEAGDDIQTQIHAHRELGWDAIELRCIDGKNVARDLPDDAFEQVVQAVNRAKLNVTGFASTIGNWNRHIEENFDCDVYELIIAAKRMKRLNVQFIRTMSWVGDGVEENHWRDETIRRYRVLAEIAEKHDIYLAHENCTGWAGLGPQQTRHLIESVGSDHLVVLFDIGNTVSHGYDPWQYYSGVKDLIRYVHVKDCKKNPAGGRSQDYQYVGEGDAMVHVFLSDLFVYGYDGVISIEPHVAKIIHEPGKQSSATQMYDSYLCYARQFVKIVNQIQLGTTS